MLHSLSVVNLVALVDRHFAQTLPSQNMSFGRSESEQNGSLAMRAYSKTKIPVVVDREVVVDIAIDAVVDIIRDVVVDDGTAQLLCCRLQDKLEKQHLENLKVRQSLGETLNSLENHEIQLALAMQDLMVATSEIKKAAKIREQLNQLER